MASLMLLMITLKYWDSQTKLGKCMWTLVVVLGFISARYLINSSYSAWQQAPISTTLTTKPLSELDFPTVTVCPPKGSHTALNYDLMKADNDSLTEQDRDNLKEAVYNTIIEPSHQEFIRLMLATVNPENVRKTVEGFHKFPDYSETIEIVMSNNYGEIQTPWFGESYNKDYYKEGKKLLFDIKISEELKAHVGRRSLVIELEVDTREEQGWQEKVVYSAWDNIAYRSEDIVEYELCNELKSWSDAEAHCQRYGGHLVSVLTQEEQELTAAAASGQTVWIGGSDQEKEGIWSWPDGSKWNYTNWFEGYGRKGKSRNCVLMFSDNDWADFPCAETFPFLCQFPAHQLTGKKNITLTFTQEQLTFSSFTALYSYYYNQELVDSWQDKRMTGFRLKWRLDPPPLEMTVQELGRSVQTPGLGGDTFDREDYMADRDYKTTLLLPHNIQEMVGKGALVVQLEVDNREKEGWKEVVKTSQGGQKIYKLY